MSLSYHPTSGALLGGPSDTPESSSSGLAGFPASPLRPTAIAIDSSVGVPSVTFSANGSRLLESPAVQESGAIAGTQLAAWSKVVEEVALEMSRKESENKRLKSRLRVTEWQLKQAEEKEGGLSLSPKSFGSGGMAREQRDGSIAGLDDSEIDQRFSEVAASFSGLERRPSLVVHPGTPLDSLVEEFGGAASGSRNQLQAKLGLQKLATGTDVYEPESSMEPSPPSTPLSAMDGIDLLGSGSVCHKQYREGEDGQSPRNNSDDSGHYRNGRNPTSGSYQQSQIQRPTSSHRNYSRFDDHPRSPLRQQSQNHTHSHQHQNDANQDALVWTGRVSWLEEQLRHRDRLLAAAHVKEAQLQSEKRSLAARAAELRMVYDQQQRCMADAAAKALQYRADLVDENMKLSRALEIAEQDRAIFVSGLMPLLAEFGLHPPSSDAAAILHSMKMVMQRLLSELSILEEQRKLGGNLVQTHLGDGLISSREMLGGTAGGGLNAPAGSMNKGKSAMDSPSANSPWEGNWGIRAENGCQTQQQMALVPGLRGPPLYKDELMRPSSLPTILNPRERQGDQQESISSSRHPDSWALSLRQIERHEQGLIGQNNMQQFLSIRSQTADSGATTSESLQQGSGQPSDVWWSARDSTTRPAAYHAPLSPSSASWVRADGQAEVGYAPSYQASQVSASPVAVETTSRPPSFPPMLPGFNPTSTSPLHQNANHGMGPHSHLNAPPQAEAASHKHVLPAQQQVLAPATSGIPDQPSAGLEVQAGGMPTDAAGTSSLVEVVVTPMNGTTFDSQGVMARNEPSQGPIRSGSLEDVQRTGSWNSRSPGISSTGTEVSFKEWPLRTTQPGQEDQRAEIGPQSPRAASPLREQSQQRQQQQQQQQHQHQHQHQHQQQQQQQQQHSPPWRQHSPPPQQQQPQQSPTSPAGRPGRQAPLGADDDRSNGSGPADGGNSAQGEVDSRSVGGSRGSRRGRGAEGNGRDRVDDSERYQGSPGGSQRKERDRRESRRSSSVGPKVEPKEGRRSRGGERSRASSSAKAEKARREGSSRRDNLPTVKEDDDRATTSEDPEDEDEIDDLPAVAGLRIVGDASLGGKLTACGNSINGTSKCIFQWVRHYMDGSSGSIHGAQDSDYLVTADDAHCLISIDCLPMDDCDRQGQVVSAFANNKNWIMLDPAMQTEFTVIQSQGVASFECNCKQQDDESFQSTSYHSYGETQPYTFNFVMKRASFSLKRNKKTELKEQYGPNLTVEIPVGQARICIVHLNDGKRIELELPDSRRRDILVLSLREFIKKALFAPKTPRTSSWHFF